MSANLKKTVALLVTAGLVGCEAVAGIQDLTYQPPGDDSGVGSDGSPNARDGSSDVTNGGDSTLGDGGSLPDATEASAPQEGGDGGAGPDAPASLDGGSDAPVGDARADATPDGGRAPDAGPGGNDAGDGGGTVPEAGPPIIPGRPTGVPSGAPTAAFFRVTLIDNMDPRDRAGEHPREQRTSGDLVYVL